MKQLLINMLLLVGLFGHLGQPDLPSQQNSIEFRNATVESQYPERLIFRIEVCGAPTKARVQIRYTTGLGSETDSRWSGEPFTFYDGRTPDGCA